MLEEKTKVIDGIEYSFMPITVTPARRMLDRLMQTFGPALAAFIKGLESLEDVKNFDIDTTDISELVGPLTRSIGATVDTFTKAIDSSLHEELVNTFLLRVKYVDNGKLVKFTKDNLEIYFATRLGLETRILLWCLSEQYADFFGPLRTALTSAGIRLKTSQSTSPSPQA
jgi:hypothetical protein